MKKVLICKCLLCGREGFRNLVGHLRMSHDISTDEYLIRFPNVEISSTAYLKERNDKIGRTLKKKYKTGERLSWNKGLTKETDGITCGPKNGNIPWNKNLTAETDMRIEKGAEKRRGRKNLFASERMKGDNNPMKDLEVRKRSIEAKTLPREIRICECGCGETFICKVKSKQKYIRGHNLKIWFPHPCWSKGLTAKNDERIAKRANAIKGQKRLQIAGDRNPAK